MTCWILIKLVLYKDVLIAVFMAFEISKLFGFSWLDSLTMSSLFAVVVRKGIYADALVLGVCVRLFVNSDLVGAQGRPTKRRNINAAMRKRSPFMHQRMSTKKNITSWTGYVICIIETWQEIVFKSTYSWKATFVLIDARACSSNEWVSWWSQWKRKWMCPHHLSRFGLIEVQIKSVVDATSKCKRFLKNVCMVK